MQLDYEDCLEIVPLQEKEKKTPNNFLLIPFLVSSIYFLSYSIYQ